MESTILQEYYDTFSKEELIEMLVAKMTAEEKSQLVEERIANAESDDV
jgi:hypothetical protein